VFAVGGLDGGCFCGCVLLIDMLCGIRGWGVIVFVAVASLVSITVVTRVVGVWFL